MKIRHAVHEAMFAGLGMRIALLVTALLFSAPSYAADFLNDLLRKGVDAATQELKQRANLPPVIPTPRTSPSVVPQSPASKSNDLHPDEINFVAPSAIERLSQAERCISLRWDGFETKARCPSHKPVEKRRDYEGRTP